MLSQSGLPALDRWLYIGSGLLALAGLIIWAAGWQVPGSWTLGHLWGAALTTWAIGLLAEFVQPRLESWKSTSSFEQPRASRFSSAGPALEEAGTREADSHERSAPSSGNESAPTNREEREEPVPESSAASDTGPKTSRFASIAASSKPSSSFAQQEEEESREAASEEAGELSSEQKAASPTVAQRLTARREAAEHKRQQLSEEEAQDWPLLDSEPLEATFRGEEPIRIRFEDLREAPSLLGQAIRRQIDHVPARRDEDIDQEAHPDRYHVRDDGPRYDLRILRSISEGKSS